MLDRLTVDERFADIVSTLAAADPELEEHFRVRMFGSEQDRIDIAEADADTEFMTRVHYDLDSHAYGLAVGRCVANLADIQVGSDFFRGR